MTRCTSAMHIPQRATPRRVRRPTAAGTSPVRSRPGAPRPLHRRRPLVGRTAGTRVAMLRQEWDGRLHRVLERVLVNPWSGGSVPPGAPPRPGRVGPRRPRGRQGGHDGPLGKLFPTGREPPVPVGRTSAGATSQRLTGPLCIVYLSYEQESDLCHPAEGEPEVASGAGHLPGMPKHQSASGRHDLGGSANRTGAAGNSGGNRSA